MSLEILGLSGSLRAGSHNRSLLRAAGGMLATRGATLRTFDIGRLPHYDSDRQDTAEPRALRAAIDAADALLIVTPEYNYSIPGVLKNAIDWASRPAYRSCLAHEPTGILAASTSASGGVRALAHLRQILGGTITPVFPHPDLGVGSAGERFDARGELVDDKTRQRLERYIDGYVSWLQAYAGRAAIEPRARRAAR